VRSGIALDAHCVLTLSLRHWWSTKGFDAPDWGVMPPSIKMAVLAATLHG
jgi:hypothetical protein